MITDQTTEYEHPGYPNWFFPSGGVTGVNNTGGGVPLSGGVIGGLIQLKSLTSTNTDQLTITSDANNVYLNPAVSLQDAYDQSVTEGDTIKIQTQVGDPFNVTFDDGNQYSAGGEDVLVNFKTALPGPDDKGLLVISRNQQNTGQNNLVNAAEVPMNQGEYEKFAYSTIIHRIQDESVNGNMCFSVNSGTRNGYTGVISLNTVPSFTNDTGALIPAGFGYYGEGSDQRNVLRNAVLPRVPPAVEANSFHHGILVENYRLKVETYADNNTLPGRTRTSFNHAILSQDANPNINTLGWSPIAYPIVNQVCNVATNKISFFRKFHTQNVGANVNISCDIPFLSEEISYDTIFRARDGTWGSNTTDNRMFIYNICTVEAFLINYDSANINNRAFYKQRYDIIVGGETQLNTTQNQITKTNLQVVNLLSGNSTAPNDTPNIINNASNAGFCFRSNANLASLYGGSWLINVWISGILVQESTVF